MTEEELDKEIEEKRGDLQVFRQAYDLIRGRMKETEGSSSKITPLCEWSGAVGLKHIMEPLLNDMERVLEELKEVKRPLHPDGEPEAVLPNLKIVDRGSDDEE